MDNKIKRLKYACYTTNISMSVVGSLSPILFLTFRSLYGISYSLLGALVLINFVTQLTVDLIFSFFSHKFNIPAAVRFTPVLSVVGLVIYALAPQLFPDNIYVGLCLGTIIFSASSGFGEVLISPVIAALPSPDPDREMSKLHSVYAWGVVGVVIFSTLFLKLAGNTAWQLLAFIFAVIPLCSAVLFWGAQIPKMQTHERASGTFKMLKNKKLWACVIAIFLGGAAECTMAQWCSGYIEKALGVPKLLGDIFGVALFAVTLGVGRTLYAKRGKCIYRVLTLGAVGAAACYITAALSNIAVLSLIACALTGLCVSMLWPGNLVVASDRFKSGGVFIFALMAAGGDLGASVGPQMVGVITDAAIASDYIVSLAANLSVTPEQLGMKLGILVSALFPLIAIPLYLKMWKNDSKK